MPEMTLDKDGRKRAVDKMNAVLKELGKPWFTGRGCEE